MADSGATGTLERPPGASLRRSLVRDTLLFSGSTVASQAIVFLRGFVVARLLGPAAFGIWGVLALVIQYGAYSQLGSINALNREVPILRGKALLTEATLLRRVVLGAALVTSGALAVLLAAATFWPGWGSTLRVGFRYVAALLVLQQAYVYILTLLKADAAFARASLLQLLLSAASLVLGIPAALWWGLQGFLASQLVSTAAVVAFSLGSRQLRIRPEVNWSQTLPLLRIGFPIVLISLSYQFLTTGDQVIVASRLGTEQLGFYRLAAMAPLVLALVPIGAAQTVYPRAAETYGRTGDERSLVGYLVRPSLTLALLMPVLIGVVFLAWPLVIKAALPDYTPGIAAAQVLTLGVFFTGICQMPAVFLTTTNRQTRYLTIVSSFVLINAGVIFAALQFGANIAGVACCVVMVTALYSFLLFDYALRHAEPVSRRRLATLVELCWPFAYMGTALGLLNRLIPHAEALWPTLGRTVLAELFWLVLSVPLLMVANRRTSVVSEAIAAVRASLRSGGAQP